MRRTENLVRVADNAFDRMQARNGLALVNGSQFANISGLSSLEVEAKETETKLTRANKRVAALTQIAASFQKINASLAGLYLCERKEQNKLIKAALAELDQYERVPVGAATPIRHARNELISMKEAVKTLHASIKKREFTVLACENAYTEINNLLHKANEAVAKLKEELQAKAEVNAAEMGDILKKTESHKLPPINKSGYAIGRAPVIPSAHVSAEKLEHSGFKVDHSSGYTIIHNQITIAVTGTFMDSLSEGRKRTSQLEAAEYLMKMLSKQLKTKLILVSNHPAAATGLKNSAWYWVMPEREYNLFTKAVFGKTTTMESGKKPSAMRWGFAF